MAHYIRCIPYQNRDGLTVNDASLWCSPDFCMTIKVGTEEDHALLMASIFRTSKHEELEDYDLFVKSELAKLVPRDAEDRALLTVNPEPIKKDGE